MPPADPMTSRDLYAFFAAMLLVCLGLGLIYLYAMGRLGAGSVFAILLGAVALIAVLAVARRLADASGPKGPGDAPLPR